MFAVERKSNTPIAADPNRPDVGTVALQPVQPQSRQTHVLRRDCYVQPAQDQSQPRSVRGLNAGLVVVQIEPTQSFMLKAEYQD